MPCFNTSTTDDAGTARTKPRAAAQRAENLAVLGVRNVLELCVGPSLRELAAAYARVGIEATGNDIDPRWQRYYPEGRWLMGDACYVDTAGFDAVVVAPPLTVGCSGRRDDALLLEAVVPSYYSFLRTKNPVTVFVLHGRAMATYQDRVQLHRFLSKLHDTGGTVEVVPLVDKVTKYVDVYWTRPVHR